MSQEPLVTLTIPAGSTSPALLSERIQENASVQKVLEQTTQVYNVAKNYNSNTKWALEKLETPVSQVAKNATQVLPLKRIDQYATNVVDRAGEMYIKADGKVVQVSDDILNRAEKAVDSYLPETRQNDAPSKAEIVQVDSNPSNTSQRERAVNLGKTLIERIQNRIYRTYLLVASVTIFLLAQSILLTLDAGREVALFVLTTGIRLVKSPRVTLLDLLERSQQGILFVVQLALHPIDLLQLIYQRFIKVSQRIALNNSNLKKSE